MRLTVIATLAVLMGCARPSPPNLPEAVINYPDAATRAKNPATWFIGRWEGSWNQGVAAVLLIQDVSGDVAQGRYSQGGPTTTYGLTAKVWKQRAFRLEDGAVTLRGVSAANGQKFKLTFEMIDGDHLKATWLIEGKDQYGGFSRPEYAQFKRIGIASAR